MTRRFILWLLLLLFLFLLLPCRVCGAERSVTASVNGESMEAVLSDGCTYVPMRRFLSALDADYELTWVGEGRCAVGLAAGHFFTAALGTTQLYEDGNALTSPAPLEVRSGASYIPLRIAAEALGLSVRWDRERACAVAEGTPLPQRYTEEELLWLTRIISAESQGETLRGQIAVGNVVLNRVSGDSFADTIYDVIFEVSSGCYQFSPVENGHIYDTPVPLSHIAAIMALAGYKVVGECRFFFSPQLSEGLWIRQNCRYALSIGCHDF